MIAAYFNREIELMLKLNVKDSLDTFLAAYE